MNMFCFVTYSVSQKNIFVMGMGCLSTTLNETKLINRSITQNNTSTVSWFSFITMLKVELYFRSLSAKKNPNLIKTFIHYLLQHIIISDHLVMLTIRNNANSRKIKKKNSNRCSCMCLKINLFTVLIIVLFVNLWE